MAKPKVKEVIVVEGRYDKNTLSQVVDAVIVELGGFAVFNDKEKQAFLRKLAKERGIILFTDPDGAGFVIRNRVKGNIPEGRVLQAYVPDIYGKEKRKRKGGKEGKLGVEGMKPEILLDALRRAGATIDEESTVKRKSITKADLYDLGLIGPDSVEKRKALCKRLEVDNSNRTLHGALLDAGLLAEVYICMTRGQGSLVIDEAEARDGGGDVELIDLSAFDLPMPLPSDEELAAHRALLADIDKASRGKLLWQTDLA